jgi:predicted nucleotide-binding protein (sugar kinase/HSP70/actin superfamily)
MKDLETSLRTCATDPVDAIAKYDELWHKMISVAEKDITKVLPVLKDIARDISTIPLKKKMENCPKVLIVGEIYVRRDDFAIDELIQHFSKRGIIGKVSSIAEWVHYCDFVRHYELKKRISLLPWYRRVLAKEFKELINWSIEHSYKHRVEKNVRKILSSTDLIPDSPHNMQEIMKNTEEHFVSQELYSEISISSGVAATAMMDGYSGIVNISPFACLIGRVIEGLITPWARERKYPVISIEIDGNILPPNVLSKLEIFMLNVMRFKGHADANSMVEREGIQPVVLDRKIIR